MIDIGPLTPFTYQKDGNNCTYDNPVLPHAHSVLESPLDLMPVSTYNRLRDVDPIPSGAGRHDTPGSRPTCAAPHVRSVRLQD